MEHNCKVGNAAPAKKTSAPFDDKLPVGRRAHGGCEHAATTSKTRTIGRYLISAQIAHIREDRLLRIQIRQRTGKVSIIRIASKLQIAIGADQGAVEQRPVKENREWECDAGGAIIAVVPYVGRPGQQNTVNSGSDIVITARRACRRRRRRRRRRGCCAAYELRLAGDAVGEDSNKGVANREAARIASHQSDRSGSERAVRPACRRIHWREQCLLIGEAQQLDQRIIGRRVLRAVTAGSFRDAFEA